MSCRPTSVPAGLRLLATGLLVLLSLASPTRVSAAISDVTEDIALELRRQGLAGAVWSFTGADGSITVGAAGERDAAGHLPMTVDTRVHIGSVTKTLIAVGALRLVTEGRLSLDTPIEPLLAGVRFENPWASTDPVTLRTLLDHTAGLDDARLHQIFSLKVSPDMPLRDAFADQDMRLPIRKRPGDAFSYSNTGYTLVAMAIESVVGEPYESWMHRELLQPLRMRDSTFRFIHQSTPQGHHLAWGHLDDLRRSGAMPIALRPAGQFTTTARDMGLFARFLLGDGRTDDGRRLVDEALLRAMGHPSSTRAVIAGLPVGYGLGLGHQVRDNIAGDCHSGNIIGFRAMFCRYPAQHRAFFLSINSDAETADYRRFDEILVRAMEMPRSPPIVPLKSSAEDPDDAPPANLFLLDPSRFERFRYADLLTAIVRLVPKADDRLELRPLNGKPRLLKSLPHNQGDGRLYVEDGQQDPSFVIYTGENGRQYLSNGYKTHVRIATMQWWALWLNLGLGVLGLLWFLLAAPWRLRLRRPDARPPFAGMAMAWALALAAPLFLLQPMTALGDRTIGSVWLYVATCAVVPLTLYQLWRSLRWPGRWSRADAFATLAVLQWCVVLIVNSALPFALWD